MHSELQSHWFWGWGSRTAESRRMFIWRMLDWRRMQTEWHQQQRYTICCRGQPCSPQAADAAVSTKLVWSSKECIHHHQIAEAHCCISARIKPSWLQRYLFTSSIGCGLSLYQGYSFGKCNFKVQRAKLSTGRVVVFNELGITGSYTLEVSLGGCSASETHFTPEGYCRLGHSLCKCIAELANINDEALLERMQKEGICP